MTPSAWSVCLCASSLRPIEQSMKTALSSVFGSINVDMSRLEKVSWEFLEYSIQISHFVWDILDAL